jgi:hypothetical protein
MRVQILIEFGIKNKSGFYPQLSVQSTIIKAGKSTFISKIIKHDAIKKVRISFPIKAFAP